MKDYDGFKDFREGKRFFLLYLLNDKIFKLMDRSLPPHPLKTSKFPPKFPKVRRRETVGKAQKVVTPGGRRLKLDAPRLSHCYFTCDKKAAINNNRKTCRQKKIQTQRPTLSPFMRRCPIDPANGKRVFLRINKKKETKL